MIHYHRRHFLLALAASLPALATATPAQPAAAHPLVEVWKDPQCGCCEDWIAHLQAHGFVVQVQHSDLAAVRQRLGVPQALASCHTAVVDGYVLEGHVPAAEVLRLLRERPQALGLTVPGMPIGSPGMDGPAYAGRFHPYDVLLMRRARLGGGVSTQVFQSYRSGKPTL